MCNCMIFSHDFLVGFLTTILWNRHWDQRGQIIQNFATHSWKYHVNTHNRWTNYMQNCINIKQQKTRTSKTRKITVDQILTINQYKQFPSCCSGTGSIKHKTESEEHSAECIPLTVAELTCRNPLGMRSCWSPCHRLVTMTTFDVRHNGCYNGPLCAWAAYR